LSDALVERLLVWGIDTIFGIPGLTYHDLIGSGNMQDADTNQVFEPFTAFNQRIMGPAHVETVTDKANKKTAPRSSNPKAARIPPIKFPIMFMSG
jgi:thiamine pyrophosphate-dependent acetolactate synthase large subunit-like protein